MRTRLKQLRTSDPRASSSIPPWVALRLEAMQKDGRLEAVSEAELQALVPEEVLSELDSLQNSEPSAPIPF